MANHGMDMLGCPQTSSNVWVNELNIMLTQRKILQNRICRHAGQQESGSPVRNQPGIEKFATGINSTQREL